MRVRRRSWVPHRRSLAEMLRSLAALEEGSDAHLSGGAENVKHRGSWAGHRVYRAVAAAGSQLCVARGGRRRCGAGAAGAAVGHGGDVPCLSDGCHARLQGLDNSLVLRQTLP